MDGYYVIKGPRLYTYCNVCCSELAAEWRARDGNEERLKKTRRAWNKAHPERCAESQRRRLATPEGSAKHVERVQEWCRKNPEKARRSARKRDATRRARELDAFVEAVDPKVVYDRDCGICWICCESVDVDDFHVDHIVPISKGGEHSYANVQLAHPRCNRVKGARYDSSDTVLAVGTPERTGV